MNKLVFATPLILLLSACGVKKPAPSDRSHPTLEGSATEAVLEVQSSKYRDSCEIRYDSIQKTIAEALDARAAELNKISGGAFEDEHWHVVPLGKIFAREVKKPIAGSKGWQSSDRESWAWISQVYEKIKNQPVDEDWVYLNQLVRGTLQDDIQRAVVGHNYLFGRLDGPKLKSIRDKLKKCLDDDTCSDPEPFSEAENFLMVGNPYYEENKRKFEHASTRDEKRAAQTALYEQAVGDFRQYEFLPTSTAKRESETELKLRLNGDSLAEFAGAGGLAALQAQLAGYVESLWKSDELSLKIEWVSGANLVTDLFRFFLEQDAGIRSHVIPSKREIHLANYVQSRAVAHEIGHVLGIRDHYYTTWIPSICGYRVEYSEEDLMSMHVSGGVLPETWEELKKGYPFQSLTK